ncbi:hypothetical protein EGS47_09850 [Acinetobacter sp. FDAARGOS_515]|nr:hypothetical protein EGS47_09850 [Acinetobacter sp. FDAARGOS_515]
MGRFVKRPNFKCPHCGSSMYIRSSRQQHPLLRALGLQCSNFCCGFSAGGNLEITHQISASATPNPIIRLQTLDQINAERKAANDEHMEEQNNG